MGLKVPPVVVAGAFTSTAFSVDECKMKAQLLEFINTYFKKVGSDLTPVLRNNFPPPPSGWLPLVNNKKVRQWADELHATWQLLCYCSRPSALQEEELYTQIPLPHPFIIPGARFRECYYWDSYWVVKGLLVSGLHDLALGIVQNLLHLVEVYGFVPNGSRTYYLNRSQPPLLSEIIKVVLHIMDDSLKKRALSALQSEHLYWTSSLHTVEIYSGEKCYKVARYKADWNKPRPESYKEDMETATAMAQHSSRLMENLYLDIASAAESGWDFSSKWFSDSKSLSAIQTTRVIPAELNAFLLMTERTVSDLADEIGDVPTSQVFDHLAKARVMAMNELFWDKNQWQDLFLSKSESLEDDAEGPIYVLDENVFRSSEIFASNWFPLCAECASPTKQQLAIDSLKSSGLLGPGGVAASMKVTGQQWDWPNVWPPIQSLLEEGCRMGGDINLSKQIAHRYLKSAFIAWSTTGQMFEKYDVEKVGEAGRGGEYECAVGFGWSNGVALSFLQLYGDNFLEIS